MPIVHKCLGNTAQLVHKGCFLALPGAATQVYHQDGVHLHSTLQKPCHAVNVFIPLVDMTKDLGGTEFCLGTHILHNEGYVPTRCETPLGPAGVPYIFDYRLGHRGMGNSSEYVRPVLYMTYSIDAKFTDKVNFNQRSYHKLGTLLEMPKSREERNASRKKSRGGEVMEVEEEVVVSAPVKKEKNEKEMEMEKGKEEEKEKEVKEEKEAAAASPKKSASIPKKKRPIGGGGRDSNKKVKR